MPSLSKRFLMASVRSNINQVFKCCTHFVQIIGVADPDYPVDPTGVVRRIVGDDAVHDLAIRHDDTFVVSRFENCGQNLDVENSACNTGGFDKITNFVGPKQNDQYT